MKKPNREDAQKQEEQEGEQENDSSTLSQLEQDVLAKTKAQSERDALTSRSSLSQLEQDVATKTHSRRDGVARPGVVAVGGGGSTQLERDIAAKTKSDLLATTPRHHDRKAAPREPATKPGVVAVIDEKANRKMRGTGASSGLTIAGQDAAQKAQARAGRITRAMPGVVSSEPGAVASSHLNRLERDVVAKVQGHSSVATKPGAVPSNSLAKLERDVAAKSQSHAPSTPSSLGNSTCLSQLEKDVMSKTHSRLISPAVVPGAVESGVSLSKHDTMAQALNRGPAQASDNCTPAALSSYSKDKVKMGTPGMSSLCELEQDVLSKRQARSTAHTSVPGASPLSALDQLEQEVIGKNQASVVSNAPPSVRISRVREQLDHLEHNVLAKHSQMHVTERQTELSNSDLAPFYDEPTEQLDGAPTTVCESSVNHYPEGPLSVEGPVSSGFGDGIQAFVAETVVDATGVAVILSEEEEERMERYKNKKSVVRGIVCFGVLVLVSVVLATVFTGRSEETATITDRPTQSPTFAPTSSDFLTIIEALKSVSGSEVFVDRLSPQFQAVMWLSTGDLVASHDFQSVYFIQHRQDKLCTPSMNSWLSLTDVCTWYGVKCNEARRVVSLNFARPSDLLEDSPIFKGEIPTEISSLTELEEIIADGHQLSGDVNNLLFGLANLKFISLEENQLSGSLSDSFGKDHPRLEELFLGGNQMTGTLPPSLQDLTHLRELQLNNNAFVGELLAELGNLPSLVNLQLQNNKFDGTIPLSYYNNHFSYLRVGGNNIQGEIQSEIGVMTQLRFLNLGDSSLGGTFPQDFFGLPNVREVHLQNAKFEGSLSEDFSNLSATVTEIILKNNNFTGQIPNAFDGFSKLKVLDLSGNPNLSGGVSVALCQRRRNMELLEVSCSVACDCCGFRDDCN